MFGQAGNDELHGGADGDVLWGGADNDVLYGDAGNDSLNGDAGNDTLYGGEGDDFLWGGTGDDFLDGGDGNDTYYYSLGSGRVHLEDSSGNDRLVLQDGIYLRMIFLSLGSLMISTGTAGDEIHLDGVDYDDLAGTSPIDVFEFSDGQTMAVAEVIAAVGIDIPATELADVLTGTSSRDNINALAGDDYIDGRGGNDMIDLGAGNDIADGGEGDDLVTAGDGDDIVHGGAGNDSVNGGTGIDSLYGDTGNDTLSGGADNDQIFGGADDDTLSGDDGDDTLSGEDGSDQLFGGAGSDTLYGGAGNDVLDGGSGVDTLYGGTGDDTYIINNLEDIVSENGDEGNDTLESSITTTLIANIENITLTSNTDINAYGNDNDNHLRGNSGNNILDGGIGADTLEGGGGDDTYFTESLGDTIIENSGQGNDTEIRSFESLQLLAANVEELTLTAMVTSGVGNNLDNIITGNDGDNFLLGMGGDDTLIGGLGNDRMEGGEGNDTYLVDSIGDIVVELEGEGNDTIETGVSIVLGANVEKVILAGGDDISATGNELDNSLIGNSGNNLLDGGLGDDMMEGGAGNDTYLTDSQNDHFYEDFDGGTDTEIRSFETNYLLSSNVENLTLAGTIYRGNGNELDNILTGNDNANNLWGREGDDSLYGMAGDDQLIGDVGQDYLSGGDGNDLMSGGADNDSLYGNAGNDQLDGGAGSNYLRGGTGNDKYVYRSDGGIYEIDNNDGGEDWLLFTDDLSADRLAFIQSGNNLIVRVDGNENRQVTINNWFLGSEYQLYAIQPAGASGITAATINRMFPPADAEADTITVPADAAFDERRYGTSADEQLIGTSGNDILRGYQGNDNLFAQGGDDWLLGGSGNDYLDGGTGNDMLHAGAGDDRYVFKAGYGEETIDNSGGGTDWLLLVDGLTQDKLVFSQVADDLVITVTDSTDKITVKNWFLGSDYQIDYIQPDGGYGIPAAQIASLITQDPSSAFDTIVNGTAGDEQLVGTVGTNQLNGLDGADQLFGLSGNDELNGGDGNDYLDGGAGDDVQNGGAGNDQLGGDAGNDLLVGGIGDDIYVYNAGAGADTIDNLGGGTDTLIFTGDITSARLSYLQSDDNLIIRVDNDETTQVTVKDWFKGAEYQLSYIQPAGQGGIPASQINDLFIVTPPPGGGDLEVPMESTFDAVRTGTAAAEQVIGTNGRDLLKGLEGNDQLFAFAGDDWLLGGDGDDYFDGGAGNDTMLGGAGNDQLGGDAGNDLMSGGLGNDKYVYRPGSGSDTIINEGGGTDWLLFTDDITSDRLSYFKSGDNLLVKIDGTSENMVTVQDWFKGPENQIAYIQPSGAYGISAAQINTMVEDEAVTTAAAMVTGGDSLVDMAAALGLDSTSGDADYDCYSKNLGLFLGDASALGVADDLSSLANNDDRVNREFLVG